MIFFCLNFIDAESRDEATALPKVLEQINEEGSRSSSRVSDYLVSGI